MKEITAAEWPWVRLWSLDYTETLYDSRRDPGTAEEYLRGSGHDSLPFTYEHGTGRAQHRQSGRLELHPDGDVKPYNDYEYLEHLLHWPNPAI